MVTINELAETLCGALGLHSELGSLSVEYLADHDMIEDGDAAAEPEDAARLLIALAGSGEGWAPHRLVERYWRLALIEPMISQHWGRSWAMEPMPDDYPFVSAIRERDARFGEVLTSLIESYVFAEALPNVPDIITLGHGPGLTRADIHLRPVAPCEIDNGFILNFSTGETRLPDDAPIARLERTTMVPPAIFDVMREVMGGISDPPDVLEHPHLDPEQISLTSGDDV